MPCSTSPKHGRQPVQKHLSRADAEDLPGAETLQVSRVRPRWAAETLVTQHALHPVTAFGASKEPVRTAQLDFNTRGYETPQSSAINGPNLHGSLSHW